MVKMELTKKQIQQLKELMVSSGIKGNLSNSALVIEKNKTIAVSESLVVTNHDAQSIEIGDEIEFERLCMGGI